MIPATVYEVNFPKKKRFRLFYFICHTSIIFLNLSLQYMILTEDILPILRANQQASVAQLYFKLQFPMILLVMLNIFFLMESLPNALAELTLYADREFY
mmetsp:Transcript_7887/g.7382  ORF Transcript_7887/g.7382 Transcript_7887/m.7382 type:complete len:99 (-) Transcript_7887:403-699(-)